MPRPLLDAGVLLSLIVIVLTALALFVPCLPRIVARIEASGDRLAFGADD
ncbi:MULTISPECIES: hypothetical protein [Kribbella]|nr:MULTISPECIES: hypothetical protein [Kribbella]